MRLIHEKTKAIFSNWEFDLNQIGNKSIWQETKHKAYYDLFKGSHFRWAKRFVKFSRKALHRRLFSLSTFAVELVATYAVTWYLWDRRITKRRNLVVIVIISSLLGRFPFKPKFQQLRFGLTAIFGTSFEDGPLWPVWSFRSVAPKCPFAFDKIVVPSIDLLSPADRNNNRTRGSLGRVCGSEMNLSIGCVKSLKFQIGIFAEWKAPLNYSWVYKWGQLWIKICRHTLIQH